MKEIIIVVYPVKQAGITVGGHGFLALRDGRGRIYPQILRGGPSTADIANATLVGEVQNAQSVSNSDLRIVGRFPESQIAVDIMYRRPDAAQKFNAMMALVRAVYGIGGRFDDTGVRYVPVDAGTFTGVNSQVINSNTYIFELMKAVGIEPRNPRALTQRWLLQYGMLVPGFADSNFLAASPSPGFGVYGTGNPQASGSSVSSSPSF